MFANETTPHQISNDVEVNNYWQWAKIIPRIEKQIWYAGQTTTTELKAYDS